MNSFIVAAIAIIGVFCISGISADDDKSGGYYSQQMSHISYPVPVPYAASPYGGYGSGAYGAGAYGAQSQVLFGTEQTKLLTFLFLLPILLGLFNKSRSTSVIGVCCINGISADGNNYSGYYSQQITHMAYPVSVSYAASPYVGYGSGAYGVGGYGAQRLVLFGTDQTKLVTFLFLLPILLGQFNKSRSTSH